MGKTYTVFLWELPGSGIVGSQGMSRSFPVSLLLDLKKVEFPAPVLSLRVAANLKHDIISQMQNLHISTKTLVLTFQNKRIHEVLSRVKKQRIQMTAIMPRGSEGFPLLPRGLGASCKSCCQSGLQICARLISSTWASKGRAPAG